MISQTDAQRRTHTLGNFEYTVADEDMYNTSNQPDFTFTGTWPRDYYRYGTISFHWNPHTVGRYVNADGEVIQNEMMAWPAGFREPPEYGVKSFYRQRPPVTLLQKSDGSISEITPPFNGTVDPNLPSDQMIELKYKTTPGIEVTKRSYSFANEHHADYIIQHNQYVVTFDADEYPGPDEDMDTTQTLQDVYFSIAYGFSNIAGTNMNQTRWYSESAGEWSDYMKVPSSLVPAGRDLLIGYLFDGQHPDISEFEDGGQFFDNFGNPRHALGIMPTTQAMPTAEFTSSTYPGYATLHVDTAPNDRTDDRSQPATVRTSGHITNIWDRTMEGFSTFWDWASSGLREGAEQTVGWPNDPSRHRGNMIYKAYGPYNLQMGDTINIVYAVGAGGISREVAEQKGKEWLNWYRGVQGADFNDQRKRELIETGRDSLIQTLERAQWAWNNGLDVSNPLTSPDLTITEGPGYIELNWTDLLGRYGSADYYRVYRKRGTFQMDTEQEIEAILRQRNGMYWPDGERRKWEVIAEVPANQNYFVDHDVIRGEPYYYGVTVVDDGSTNTGLISGPLESSKFANRGQTPAIPFEPGEGSTDNIRVVPNPYFASAGDFNFSDDSNNLLFVNLPPFATLRIFTARGDLVKVIHHTSGSGDEIWDQVTDYNQLASSGVYILHVSDARDGDMNPLPDAIVKFVIVR
ncbi:hypothetical protein QA596_02310 [Balneolales bacterium ANBcel1]|nr:hypothetical protein [Balneolales bacterium ANBcel1]